MRESWLRLIGIWQRQRRERELAEELEFHKAMKMSTGKTASQANREFGGFEKWKEVCRDVGRWRSLEEFGRDILLAIRLLRKSPLFTSVALVTLTLAIGANTAIFSLMNEVMLKALPVPNAKRLATLRIQPEENFGYAFSYPLLQAVEKRAGSLMTVFTYTDRGLPMRGPDGVETVAGQLVSGQYFAALGLKPQMGRWIEPHDDRPGAPDGMVAVVSDHFWRSRLGADLQPIGRQITLSQLVFTVVGVMPKGFRGMSKDSSPDVFVPFQLEPLIDAPFNSLASGYHNWWFSVGAELKPGVSLQRVDAFLRANSRALFHESIPGGTEFQLNGHGVNDLYLIAEPGENGLSFLRVRFHRPLAIVMVLVLIVLLIACLNLATLLTARAASRTREITTRYALGASRARLLRQLLTESLLLAAVGSILGFALSPLLSASIATILAPQHDPHSTALHVQPDVAVFGFAALVVIVATALTGTMPAFRATGQNVQASIRESSNAIRGADRRHLWPRILLALEVALSLILVTGASLLGYSLVKLHETPAGFEAKGLWYLDMTSSGKSIKGQVLLDRYRELINEFQRFPGVQAVSAASLLPLTDVWNAGDMKVPGGTSHEIWRNQVGPEYFAAMRTPVFQGREFRWSDSDKSGKKCILNEAAVKLFFPNGKPLGRYLTDDEGKTTQEVIAVVADAKYTTMRATAPPTVYSPITQDVDNTFGWVLLIRATGAPGPLIANAVKIIRRSLPDLPAPAAFNMEDTVAESIATERVMATLALFFGGLALLITGVGLYGTLAYATERRTGEIGIRLALGARRGHVISLVCTENISIAIIGCLVGLAGSIAASKLIASFLFGVSAQDPLLFAAAALALLAVAIAASLVPAVKASRIDPIAAIRYE